MHQSNQSKALIRYSLNITRGAIFEIEQCKKIFSWICKQSHTVYVSLTFSRIKISQNPPQNSYNRGMPSFKIIMGSEPMLAFFLTIIHTTAMIYLRSKTHYVKLKKLYMFTGHFL